ncbi:MAG TPA: tryptophan synthase subunit alpha, partial [bacterium]|nr:tryptophan synthase subunit alpha [bacterium]
MKISECFKHLKEQKRVGLIVYITAGYPDIVFTEKFAEKLQDAGVDMIEIGVPFSDPIADGPVIQQASQKALENHTNMKAIMGLCCRLKQKLHIPYLLMSYYNPIYKYGLKKFADDCNVANVSGVIVPDLPFEESQVLHKELEKYGIDLIVFISVTTSEKRRKKILRHGSGFIYYIAVCGVTGTRDALPGYIYKDLSSLQKQSKIPVAVGFGISTES